MVTLLTFGELDLSWSKFQQKYFPDFTLSQLKNKFKVISKEAGNERNTEFSKNKIYIDFEKLLAEESTRSVQEQKTLKK